MTTASLEFQIAEFQLRDFERQGHTIAAGPESGDEVARCEQWLRAGIDVYRWLARSEETLRVADAEGLADMTAAVEDAIHQLYLRWQTLQEAAAPRIAKLVEDGHELSGLAEYLECAAEVTDWLEHHEFYLLGQKCLLERFEEE